MDTFPLSFRTKTLDGSRPYIVGVLNVTPDSFSDGGQFVDPARARARASELVREGADWVEVGGESTRPGAAALSAKEERVRVIPIIEALAAELGAPIAVDTYKAEVARAALAAGAEIINDISGGLLDDAILGAAAERGATFVLGHLRGRPETMQERIAFDDVFVEVAEELGERVTAAREAGIDRLVVDPGIGFGKRASHNLELIRRAGDLSETLGKAVMIGASRKAFLGELTGISEPGARLAPSVVAAVMAVWHGAQLLRVHDVAATKAALAVAAALAPKRDEGAA